MTPDLAALVERLNNANTEELHGRAAINLSRLIGEAVDALEHYRRVREERDALRQLQQAPVRYVRMTCVLPDEAYKIAHESPIYSAGDMIAVWANEGDLCRLGVDAALASPQHPHQ